MRRTGQSVAPARLIALCVAGLLIGADAVVAANGPEPESVGPAVPDHFRVQRPGIVLSDPVARRERLGWLDEATLLRWCGEPRSKWPRHGVARNVRSEEQAGETLAWSMMTAGGRVLAFDDEDAFKAIRSNLRRWAKGGALGKFEEPARARMYYNLNRTLLPIIVNYGLTRNHRAWKSDDRERVERWLGELIWRRGPQRFFDRENKSSRNNHRYVSAAVNMAWGALMGVDSLFKDGVRAVLMALEDMAPDGSLPLEMTRGTLALNYQRHAIESLVAISEMAALQSFDLYALQGTDGQSIHRAVDFLADALEDPRILELRLRENGHEIEGPQELNFLAQRPHRRHYMAWLEAYRARFHDRASVVKLETAMAVLGEPVRPLIDDHSGANMTCLFAEPRADDPWEP